MSTNPNNAVGTNAAYNGRTSVKAFNDSIGAYSSGILSGWACSPNTGMTVSLGGDGTTRDIAIAEDVAGNKTTINNISEAPISVTMGAAPSTNSRIDLIVAYVDNPPQGAATSIDNPGACGLIAVEGTAAANPVAPNDSAIRTAITADGASGSTAYYVVLATITIASGTTDLTSSNIAAGSSAGIGSQNIDFKTFGGNYSESEIDTNYTWVDGKKIYKKTILFASLSNASNVSADHNIVGLADIINITGLTCQNNNRWRNLNMPAGNVSTQWTIVEVDETKVYVYSGNDQRSQRASITLYYTKTN